MTQITLIEHMEAARPEECRTFNNRYLLVLANHNILILNKREQKIEGLEVDPNPSSFLPLYSVSHNSSNCIPLIYITIYILANYHPLLTTWTSKFDRTPSSNGTSGGQTQDRQVDLLVKSKDAKQLKCKTRKGKEETEQEEEDRSSPFAQGGYSQRG